MRQQPARLALALAALGVLAVASPQAPAAPGPQAIFADGFERDLVAWSTFVTPCLSDDHCNRLLRFWSRCTVAGCVECIDDGDCLANPTALGTACDGGSCQCSTGGCAANPAGPVCAASPVSCTCASSLDCTPPAECRATPYLGGATTCWAGLPP
jgi:hypothetical protein